MTALDKVGRMCNKSTKRDKIRNKIIRGIGS
jgi:hypothetical protein